jgi:hypothetical protein
MVRRDTSARPEDKRRPDRPLALSRFVGPPAEAEKPASKFDMMPRGNRLRQRRTRGENFRTEEAVMAVNLEPA